MLEIVKNTDAISREIFVRVDKVDRDIKNLDDVIRQLAQEQHEVNVKVSKLLNLPQDVEEVKQRLVSLSNLTNKLINQQFQLYEVTVKGIQQTNKNPAPNRGYDQNLRNRLSELFQLMQQLTIQQSSLMKVENKNSRNHSQEIASLASKVYKVEQTITRLLQEQQVLLGTTYRNNMGGFRNLDNKFNLLNEAVKQLVNQQQKIMKLAGLGRLVMEQSKDIRGVKDNLATLADVVNQLVNQQRDLLVRTKYEKEYITNDDLDKKFNELKDTVLNIVMQQRIIVERNVKQRERNGYSQPNGGDETISLKLEDRVGQLTDLMRQLILQQKETILHISRKDSTNYGDIVGKINSRILRLNELTKELFVEQTSVIQRGLNSLSKQQSTGFRKLDIRLDNLGGALKKLSNRDNGALDRRIQALSQQQSNDTNKLNIRLSQISKMLERVVNRPSTEDNKGLGEIRTKLNRLEGAITRILGKLDKGGNLHLSQEQIEELKRVSLRLPDLNQSVEKLALVEEVEDPVYIQELVDVEQSLDEYGKSVVGISGSLGKLNSNSVEKNIEELDVLDINADSFFGDDNFDINENGNDILRADSSAFGGGTIITRRRIGIRRNGNKQRSRTNSQSNVIYAGGGGSSRKAINRQLASYGRTMKAPLKPIGISDSTAYDSPINFQKSQGPSALHEGYEYRQGYWYPKNDQFEEVTETQ
ncbi:hypothetical protein K7432_014096 [Basidiobolus ranarum]|uniref:Uncharacterized protein n=1 Tax=Basidiobolus ranarum TaxID=34480 RepID=A0ABR2WI46_9FUNG